MSSWKEGRHYMNHICHGISLVSTSWSNGAPTIFKKAEGYSFWIVRPQMHPTQIGDCLKSWRISLCSELSIFQDFPKSFWRTLLGIVLTCTFQQTSWHLWTAMFIHRIPEIGHSHLTYPKQRMLQRGGSSVILDTVKDGAWPSEVLHQKCGYTPFPTLSHCNQL